MTKTDILDTENYRKHHVFYFALVINFLLAFIWTAVLMGMGPIYSYLRDIILSHSVLNYSLFLVNIMNNTYQVYAHIFTGTKFLGFRQVVPYGSDETQSLMEFTMSNVFDILGWITIYLYYGYASLFFAVLAAFHFSSGLISVFFNKTFHEYFIGPPENTAENNKNTFGYVYWRLFRSLFVFTDAVSRGYLSYCMLLDYI